MLQLIITCCSLKTRVVSLKSSHTIVSLPYIVVIKALEIGIVVLFLRIQSFFAMADQISHIVESN